MAIKCNSIEYFLLHISLVVTSIVRNVKLTKVANVMHYLNAILIVTSEFQINFDLSQKAKNIL